MAVKSSRSTASSILHENGAGEYIHFLLHLQVCVGVTAAVKTLTFTLSETPSDMATVTLAGDPPSGSSVGVSVTTAATTGSLAGAAVETASVDVNSAFSVCLIIADGKKGDFAAAGTYTLTVGGTQTDAVAGLVPASADLKVSVAHLWVPLLCFFVRNTGMMMKACLCTHE